jgi:hypothetical protein
MEIPEKIKPFIHQAHWDFIGVERLDEEDRALIIRVLEAAFAGQNREDVDEDDLKDVVQEVKATADALAVSGDEDVDDEEVPAAVAMSEDILEESGESDESGE